MEVDDFQKQVSKFQRVSSNGSSTTTTDNSQKIATHRGILESPNDGGGGGGGGGRSESKYGVGLGVGGGARLCGWPTSRIVRVSRASGGKDRHSKVLTSKGLRDRRVRLSVSTAIQFYDLQDRLGYDQPSKAVEWLLKAAETSIDELPCLDPPFTGGIIADYSQQLQQHQPEHIDDRKNVKSNVNTTNSIDFEDHPGYSQQQNRLVHNNNNNSNVVTKSPACSSTSETSKGSGLSLSNRSENRIKARERARKMASKKEKDKETTDQLLPKTCALNPTIENSSFTDLLTGGISTTTTTSRPSSETRTHWTTPPMDYFFGRNPNPSAQLIQIPQFNNQQHPQHHHQQQHFAFLQDGFAPAVATAISGGGGGGGGGESYNLNFSMTPLSSNSNAALAPGFSRGTLQSNLPSTLLPHHSHHLQRFQSSSVDGLTSGNNNMPFFLVPNPGSDHFPSSYPLLSYGNGANSDQHKEKSKH